MIDNGTGGEEAAQLPFAHGRSFASLDAYLAYLRDHAGPVGHPGIAKSGRAFTSS